MCLSLGQIKEIPCGHSRGHMYLSADLKALENVCLDKFLMSPKLGHVRS